MVAAAGPQGAAAVPAIYAPFDPNDPLAADYAAAENAIADEDFATAERLLRGLASAAPDVADVWSLLGFARRKLGRFEAAEAAYAEALALDPRHSGALTYLGALRIEQGDLGAARAILDRLDSFCFGTCAGRDDLAAAIAEAEGG
jgi:Flp pilus assembly protein TadD